jgi:hypothetical protein
MDNMFDCASLTSICKRRNIDEIDDYNLDWEETEFEKLEYF